MPSVLCSESESAAVKMMVMAETTMVTPVVMMMMMILVVTTTVMFLHSERLTTVRGVCAAVRGVWTVSTTWLRLCNRSRPGMNESPPTRSHLLAA